LFGIFIGDDMKKISVIIGLILFVGLSALTTAQISSIKTVVSLTGSFYNESTKEPVTVRFEAFDASGKRVYRGNSNATEKGYYFITGLTPGQTITMRITDMNFLMQEITYAIPETNKYQEFSKDFLVVPKVKNTEILFGVSPFELSKSKIRFGSDYYLNDIQKILSSNSRVVFEIVCYPDNDQNSEHNTKLTLERANAIKNYFINNGCKAEKILVRNESTTDPKIPPPPKKQAKGKRYIGSTYLIIKEIQ
jgi:outer membrane protein OmpA-like peptidoglycan-associated protein